MLTAINRFGVRTTIMTASHDEIYFCPICRQPLIQKQKGNLRCPHFAHYGSKNGKYAPCSDRWGYDKTEWHYNWQLLFPEENYEVVVTLDGKKHVADVLINGTVVEFQHSSISLEEFTERNEFYKEAGYKVIWVFDLRKEFTANRIQPDVYGDNYYIWAHAKKLFREMNLEKINARIFFQFIDPSDPSNPILELVTGSYNRFSKFRTSKDILLSTEQFVQGVATGSILTIYDEITYSTSSSDFCFLRSGQPKASDTVEEIGCVGVQSVTDLSTQVTSSIATQEQKAQITLSPQVSGGKSIRELWSTDYEYILVRNMRDNQVIYIFGNDGIIDSNDWGKILGKNTTLTETGRFVYIGKKYAIRESTSPIWKMIYFAIRKEILLQRSTAPVPGAHTLLDLINASSDTQLFVKCVPEGKTFVIDIKSRGYGNKEAQFWAKEIDTDTGEESNSNSYDFYYPRRKLQIWKIL